MLAPDAIIPGANSRHREALVLALGGAVQKRAGSRVRVELRGHVWRWPSPAPRQGEAKRYQVEEAREPFERAGVKP